MRTASRSQHRLRASWRHRGRRTPARAPMEPGERAAEASPTPPAHARGARAARAWVCLASAAPCAGWPASERRRPGGRARGRRRKRIPGQSRPRQSASRCADRRRWRVRGQRRRLPGRVTVAWYERVTVAYMEQGSQARAYMESGYLRRSQSGLTGCAPRALIFDRSRFRLRKHLGPFIRLAFGSVPVRYLPRAGASACRRRSGTRG